MEILLNGQPLSVDGIDSEVNVDNLLDVVEESLLGSASTVYLLIIDGKKYLPDDDREKLANIKLIKTDTIELFTATAREMLEKIFSEAEVYLNHLEVVALEVASDLRIGNTKDAMDKHITIIDGIEWLSTILENTATAFTHNIIESSLEIDRQSLLSRLTEHATLLHSAQENKDWIGLADILEYEFTEIFKDTKVLVTKILKS